MSLASSKYGIMWPKASHGNMAMWSFELPAMGVKFTALIWFLSRFQRHRAPLIRRQLFWQLIQGQILFKEVR
jgi:hypothetical protein